MAAELVLNTREAHRFESALSCPEFLSRSLDVVPPVCRSASNQLLWVAFKAVYMSSGRWRSYRICVFSINIHEGVDVHITFIPPAQCKEIERKTNIVLGYIYRFCYGDG